MTKTMKVKKLRVAAASQVPKGAAPNSDYFMYQSPVAAEMDLISQQGDVTNLSIAQHYATRIDEAEELAGQMEAIDQMTGVLRDRAAQAAHEALKQGDVQLELNEVRARAGGWDWWQAFQEALYEATSTADVLTLVDELAAGLKQELTAPSDGDGDEPAGMTVDASSVYQAPVDSKTAEPVTQAETATEDSPVIEQETPAAAPVEDAPVVQEATEAAANDNPVAQGDEAESAAVESVESADGEDEEGEEGEEDEDEEEEEEDEVGTLSQADLGRPGSDVQEIAVSGDAVSQSAARPPRAAPAGMWSGIPGMDAIAQAAMQSSDEEIGYINTGELDADGGDTIATPIMQQIVSALQTLTAEVAALKAAGTAPVAQSAPPAPAVRSQPRSRQPDADPTPIQQERPQNIWANSPLGALFG